MQKKIEITVPERTYNLLAEASRLCGVPLKNFVASGATEKALSILEGFSRSAPDPATMELQGRLIDILKNPNSFLAPAAPVRKKRKPIGFSDTFGEK